MIIYGNSTILLERILSYSSLRYIINNKVKWNLKWGENLYMSNIKLVNVTEEIVRGLVGFLLHGVEYQTFCHCEQCEMDVNAIALNALPTKYVASEKARDAAFKQLNTPENIEEINKQIIRALHIVSRNPSH